MRRPPSPTRSRRSSPTSCASARSASAARSRSSATCSATSSSGAAGSAKSSTSKGSRSRSSPPVRSRRSSPSISAGSAPARSARRSSRWRSSCPRSSWCSRSPRVYVRYGGLAWMQGAFYGIGAAVIAIIARSAWKLVRMTLGEGSAALALFALSALVTAWTESELVCPLRRMRRRRARRHAATAVGAGPAGAALVHAVAPHRAPRRRWRSARCGRSSSYFAEAGAFVFGSGLAIVPFLHGGVVEPVPLAHRAAVPRRRRGRHDHAGPGGHHGRVHRLPRRGPARRERSPRSACSSPATCSWSSPPPYFRRSVANPSVKAFVDGVTAAATGAIAGAAFVLGRRAMVDVPTRPDLPRHLRRAHQGEGGLRAARDRGGGDRGGDDQDVGSPAVTRQGRSRSRATAAAVTTRPPRLPTRRIVVFHSGADRTRRPRSSWQPGPSDAWAQRRAASRNAVTRATYASGPRRYAWMCVPNGLGSA